MKDQKCSFLSLKSDLKEKEILQEYLQLYESLLVICYELIHCLMLQNEKNYGFNFHFTWWLIFNRYFAIWAKVQFTMLFWFYFAKTGKPYISRWQKKTIKKVSENKNSTVISPNIYMIMASKSNTFTLNIFLTPYKKNLYTQV